MAKNISKPAPAQESVTVERWVAPNVETMRTMIGDDGNLLSSTPLTAEQIQKIQQDAYKESYDQGLAKGYAEGIKQSQEYIQQQVALMNAVLNQCASPMSELDHEVEDQLTQLSIALTRQLVRREIKSEPGQIVAIVREAMQVLPVSSRDVKVFLHPEDVVLMKEALATSDSPLWTLMDDPTLMRGDCRIQTDSSSIDATIERRLASVIANMMGGERKRDSSDEEADSGTDPHTGQTD